ncbi:MAG: hypothetical protein HQL23_02845 [Candidatus Omnitrophica bacterium]|nr:hypothetical protein [Candidatus Omnitrophota bacterium]
MIGYTFFMTGCLIKINDCVIFRLFRGILLVMFILALPGSAPAQFVGTLPVPGAMVNLSSTYNPAVMKGLIVHSDNPLKFDFLISPGDVDYSRQPKDAKVKEYQKLIKYFLAALTVPEKNIWVNLSPYEKNRIIPDDLGKTEMGRDLLAQDYILKQLTASLLDPQKDIGKAFWDRIYKEAKAKFGTDDIPVDTFNKVWIMPDKAEVYEQGNTVFIVDSHLNVMLEEDYLAERRGAPRGRPSSWRDRVTGAHEGRPYTRSGIVGVSAREETTRALASQIMREIIIPAIEKEVNEGKNFALLRQINHSLILAAWYKKALKESFLGKHYVDKGKTAGVNQADVKNNQKIYDRYVAAFKTGVMNYVKEDVDPLTEETVTRQYFSGGFAGQQPLSSASPLAAQKAVRTASPLEEVTVNVHPAGSSPGSSPIVADRSLPQLSGYNFLEQKDFRAAVAALASDLGRKTEVLRIREEIASQTVFLRHLGGLAGFNGSVIYYPLGGVDVYTPFALDTQATDVVVMNDLPFGSFKDLIAFCKYADPQNKAGGRFLANDYARQLSGTSEDYNGVGGLVLGRIISLLRGEVSAVHFFRLNDDGEIVFVKNENDREDHAVIEFKVLNENGERITKRFWYIRNDAFHGQFVNHDMKNPVVFLARSNVLIDDGYIDPEGVVLPKILDDSSDFITHGGTEKEYADLKATYQARLRYHQFISHLSFQHLLIKAAQNLWETVTLGLSVGFNETTARMIYEITIFPAARPDVTVLSDIETEEDAPGSMPTFWESTPSQYRWEGEEKFGYSGPGQPVYFGRGDLLKKPASSPSATRFDWGTRNRTNGGIDLISAFQNLRVKRDRSGAALPLKFQDVPNVSVDINGLVPVIQEIAPVKNLPLLLGFKSASAANQYGQAN